MKKFIILMVAIAIGTTMFASSAHADASFNSPGLMQTVTVTNATTQPCTAGPIDGCWKSSTTASPGDIIAVQLYFKNTSSETATGVTLGVEPSRSGTQVTFNGGVAATNAPRATGTATVTLSQVETITSESQSGSYQADWALSPNGPTQPVNTDELFGTGFPIGSLAPGAQGALVVRFVVNGTATVTPPPAASCVINNFASNPGTITLGGTSSLSWNTSNCDYVNVSSVGSNLATDNDGYTVSPTNTTTYTLTAYPGGATATAIVTVNNASPTPTCSINNFIASPSSIQSGSSSNLNWSTTNCTYVNINATGSNLPANGTQSVSPTNTTTYTLTAYPGGHTASVTVTVTNPIVQNVCSINSFTASPSSIQSGSSSNLNWTTTNCNYVSISSIGTNLSANGSQSVSPESTQNYTLTAYPGGEQSTVTITVTNPVQNVCSINNFTASPSSIQNGGSSSLNWNTTNCNYVNISSLGSNLAADGSQTVYPTNTTTYTLTAYPGGQTASVTVTVNTVTNNSCIINNFNANPSSIQSGSSSNLTWDTSNCSYVNISGLGQLSTSGNQTVYPSNTTTYTLTAYPGGQTSQATVSVYNNTITNYCSINSFYVDSNSLTQGQETELHWTTSGTNSVYISGFGTENANGSISISPYQSTTYTMTVNGTNCSGGGSQSVYVTVTQPVYNNPTVTTQQEQPQAITTVATVVSSYSAELNGIAVPNVSYGTTNAWFEYGSSPSMGSSTTYQVVNGYGSDPYSANVSGLIPGATYYYRADVQNQNGIAYGSVVPFTMPNITTTSTYTPPARVIVETRTVTTNNGIVAKSQASLFKLEVDSSFDHMCLGGDITYTVNYQNISSQELDNSILRITFPGELDYASSSQGDYDVTDRTLTISLGTVEPGEQGSVTVNAQVNNQAVQGKLAVITATMVYTNPITLAQENAIAYSLITISNDCPTVLGASVFGFGSFLPQTLLEWLLLILVILALIVLARSLAKKKEEPAKTA